MTYKDFTLESIRTDLGLKVRHERLFAQVEPVEAPQSLRDALNDGMPIGLTSEKARSEFIVAPVLLAARTVTGKKFYIYSGQTLDSDAARGLTGECDFILTHSESTPLLTAPIMTLVEAKKNDIELGLGQCIAQMVGAQIFNQKTGGLELPVFGCVTTGEDWQFIKLDGQQVTLETNRYYIVAVEQILGMLKSIVNLFEQVPQA